MNSKSIAFVAFTISALLVPACQEMPEDAYSSNMEPPPAGAEFIDQETYDGLKRSGELSVFTKRTPSEQAARQAEEDAADQATIDEFMAAHPELGELVPPDPPEDDPTVTKRPDGNYDHTVQVGPDETITVVTHGRRWWNRVIADRIRVFPTRDNQIQLYRALFEGIPEEVRVQLDLMSPDDIENDPDMTSEAILELTRMIAEPENATPIFNALYPNVHFSIPPMFLADCENEIGFGGGGDQFDSLFDGTRDFALNGLVRNYDWVLRKYLTCVKSQHDRGTCTSFAISAAIEILVQKIHGDRVNLSEQALYNRARTKWDTPNGTIDTLSIELALEGMYNDGWLLYFENQWNYNPSDNRVQNCVLADGDGNCLDATYTHSCDNYTETCSDTIQQSQFACYDNGTWYFCGYSVPEKNANNNGYRIGPIFEFWDPLDTASSIDLMKLLLAEGYPVVFAHAVTSRWDCAEINSFPCPAGGVNGYLRYIASDTIRGGHAICAVGFIDNNQLSDYVTNVPQGAGGGYFIVKNSWGNGWGDGGFVYVPYQSMLDYAGSAVVIWKVL